MNDELTQPGDLLSSKLSNIADLCIIITPVEPHQRTGLSVLIWSDLGFFELRNCAPFSYMTLLFRDE
jgi:hypothetical protein